MSVKVEKTENANEVKLEITGNQNDELIKYLDDILSGLKYQDGNPEMLMSGKIW